MQIDIISDTICPWCFIGKRRLERALAERNDLTPHITWWPFQLNPEMPREGIDRDTYLNVKFGGPERATEIYTAIREAGASEDIDFAFERIARTPSTLDSHRLIHWAKADGRQDALVEVLFRRYFLEGADVGNPGVLAEVATEAGMDGDAVRRRLAGDEDLDLVREQDASAREMGVNGVPLFVIDKRYAVSGAQDPKVFLQVFDLATREGGDAAAGFLSP